MKGISSIVLDGMWPLGIIPALFFCAITWWQNQRGWPLRDAAIRAGVITGVWVAAGAELLSLVHALSFWPLLIWWTIPTLIILRKCKSGPLPVVPQPSQDKGSRLLLAAGGLLLAITFLGAAFASPNNWDVLSYHLPRQVYWMQQHSVANFPTQDWRMLAMPPLAEFAGVQLMILSGGDHWSSLIQWLAFGLTALTASAIARDLGCGERLQVIAAVLVLTIPPALLESTTGKNDVVVAFYFCALIYLGLKIYQNGNTAFTEVTLLAAACGLLVLTKGTGMIFGLAAAGWITAAFFRRVTFKRAILCGALTGVIVLAINLGHFIRTHLEFGSPVVTKGLGNQIHDAQALLSNVARNTARHLATPSTNMNAVIEQGVLAFHRWIHMDVNDPRTTFRGTLPFSVNASFSDDDYVTAPIHILLAIGALIPIAGDLFRNRDKIAASCLLVPYAGYALFCLLLSWQIWGSRLQVPLFCLAGPVVAYAVGKQFPRLMAVCIALAVALALFSAVTNKSKPLVGKRFFLLRPTRARTRYYPNGEDVRPGLSALRVLCREREPKSVGIFARWNRCEYLLLWNLLYGDFPEPRLVKLNVTRGKAPSAAPSPDLVVGWFADPGETNAPFQEKFVLVTNAGPVRIYSPRGNAQALLRER